MNPTKDLIFISHATPQDNYCSLWLASKLKMLGYNVWIDMDDLSAGDSFNTVIKPIIQNEAKIFVAVTTKSYSEKANNQNSGVSRELNCAATINTSALGHNFILPLRFDDINYNDFPYHYIGRNAIDFEGNWQQGLTALVQELEKLKIETKEFPDNPLPLWFETIKAQAEPLQKEESYFSNWFSFSLPEKIFIHTPELFIKEELYDKPYAFNKDSNRIITFATADTVGKWTRLKSSICFQY